VPGNFRQGTNQAASVAYNGLQVGPGKFNLNANYDQDSRARLLGPT